MSSPPNSTPDDKFKARLDRVADARAPFDASKPYVSPVPDWRDTVGYPVAILGGFLVGILAVVFARYVRFQVLGSGLAGDDPDITMVIDATLAGACSFFVFALLRIDGAAVKASQTLGIVAMVIAMHNVVHAVPGLFSVAFSKSWTENVVASTKPNSVLFRGASIVVYEPGPKAPKRPTVRRAGKS